MYMYYTSRTVYNVHELTIMISSSADLRLAPAAVFDDDDAVFDDDATAAVPGAVNSADDDVTL